MTDIAQTTSTAWWQLTIQVPQRAAEDAGAVLIEAGALGVQSVDGAAEPYPSFARHAITAQPAFQVPRDKVVLVASYKDHGTAATIKRAASQALASLSVRVADGDMQVVRRTDHGWAEAWKQYFKPLKVARRLWIVPSWEHDFVAPNNTVVLSLDPGMAFGTGQHATTLLCLQAIERYAERLGKGGPDRPNLLDLGCGSGILAIAAAKLGFNSCVALDNDRVAVDAARDNVQKNNVQARIEVGETPLESISERFTVVVANILSEPLIQMAQVLAGRVKPGGVLLLSGLLSGQADAVQKAYERTGLLEPHGRWTHGQWAALALRRLGKSLL